MTSTPGGQAHPAHLAERRVRLLGGHRVDAGAYAASLRRSGQAGRLVLLRFRLPALTDQLLDGRHAVSSLDTPPRRAVLFFLTCESRLLGPLPSRFADPLLTPFRGMWPGLGRAGPPPHAEGTRGTESRRRSIGAARKPAQSHSVARSGPQRPDSRGRENTGCGVTARWRKVGAAEPLYSLPASLPSSSARSTADPAPAASSASAAASSASRRAPSEASHSAGLAGRSASSDRGEGAAEQALGAQDGSARAAAAAPSGRARPRSRPGSACR